MNVHYYIYCRIVCTITTFPVDKIVYLLSVVEYNMQYIYLCSYEMLLFI